MAARRERACVSDASRPVPHHHSSIPNTGMRRRTCRHLSQRRTCSRVCTLQRPPPQPVGVVVRPGSGADRFSIPASASGHVPGSSVPLHARSQAEACSAEPVQARRRKQGSRHAPPGVGLVVVGGGLAADAVQGLRRVQHDVRAQAAPPGPRGVCHLRGAGRARMVRSTSATQPDQMLCNVASCVG